MSLFVTFTIGVLLLLTALGAAGGIAHAWRAWRGRRAAKRRAYARHPANPARRPLRQRAPGLPVDGEPLDDDDLDEFTGVMIASGYDGWRGNQAQDTGASEDTE